nr:DUF615 domain-containing protein [Desulfosarcina cetonica]
MDMPEEIEKSRTRKKKEAKALQQIGERLTTLSEVQLGRMALPSDLMEALLDAKACVLTVPDDARCSMSVR